MVLVSEGVCSLHTTFFAKVVYIENKPQYPTTPLGFSKRVHPPTLDTPPIRPRCFFTPPCPRSPLCSSKRVHPPTLDTHPCPRSPLGFSKRVHPPTLELGHAADPSAVFLQPPPCPKSPLGFSKRVHPPHLGHTPKKSGELHSMRARFSAFV